MKKIITIKIEVDTNHQASDEWHKKKDFVDSEIEEILDHIRDFTRPYKKESGKSRRRHSAESYKVVVNNIYLTSDNYFTGCGGIICDDDSLDFQSKNAKSF